jgi:DNA-binding response OmpR family regulator
MKILIVEDNALVAMDLEQQLLFAGHEVIGIASTVAEAIEVARNTDGDLALMDVSLADGSSGVDAARLLKNRYNIPSVYITADLPGSPEVRLYGIGHLSKPFDEGELLRSVSFIRSMMRGDTDQPQPSRLRLFPEQVINAEMA